jgi:cytoskeletal protein CcmA (bactofilin family)
VITPSRRDTEPNASAGHDEWSAATASRADRETVGGTGAVSIGPKISIKGELIGNEDLTVHGRVEGTIRLQGHHLTIGPEAKVNASIQAKSVKIDGTVEGKVSAAERVDLSHSGALTGDIEAPRISISEGARFRGTVDMNTPGAHDSAATVAPGKPTQPEDSRERTG